MYAQFYAFVKSEAVTPAVNHDLVVFLLRYVQVLGGSMKGKDFRTYIPKLMQCLLRGGYSQALEREISRGLKCAFVFITIK